MRWRGREKWGNEDSGGCPQTPSSLTRKGPLWRPAMRHLNLDTCCHLVAGSCNWLNCYLLWTPKQAKAAREDERGELGKQGERYWVDMRWSSGTQDSRIQLGPAHLNCMQAARWRSPMCSGPSPGRCASQSHVTALWSSSDPGPLCLPG